VRWRKKAHEQPTLENSLVLITCPCCGDVAVPMASVQLRIMQRRIAFVCNLCGHEHKVPSDGGRDEVLIAFGCEVVLR
jgi:RNase P subunit RPR2